jgi:hypothetical protein
MSALHRLAEGGFAFLEGVFPYSQGAVALDGYALERVRFARPVPLAEGFRRIAAHLQGLGRPKTALCACELRSPRPFSFDGFGEFNRGYVAVLEQWGLYRDGRNAVARSNVAPEIDPPAEPSFYAFSYAVPAAHERRDFVVAGSGEWPEGGRFPEDIVSGLNNKVVWVLDKMEERMRGLGAFGFGDASAVQVYTVQRFPMDLVAQRAGSAVVWQYCRPPIEGLEFEMDARSVSVERRLA